MAKVLIVTGGSRGIGHEVVIGAARAGWAGIGLGPVVLLGVASVFLLMPETLIAAFAVESAAVRDLAVSFLAVAALFQIFDGTQAIAQGALRGLKDTRVPMYFALFSYWLFGMPVCALLGFGLDLGAVGIWLGLAAALGMAALLLVLRFRRLEQSLLRPPGPSP